MFSNFDTVEFDFCLYNNNCWFVTIVFEVSYFTKYVILIIIQRSDR